MKTTDGGYTWKAVTDKYFGGTIGGIAIYPPNPDIKPAEVMECEERRRLVPCFRRWWRVAASADDGRR